MWLEQRLKLLEAHNPAVVWGEGEWGVAYLIAALGQPQRPLVWIELEESDRNDPILQGNKLAEALTRATDRVLSGYGMPLGYVLTVLQSQLGSLGPLTVALSGAEYGPTLARGLSQLANPNLRVLLHYQSYPLEVPTNRSFHLLGPAELALQPDEARQLAANTLDTSSLQSLLHQTGGAFERFVASLSPGGQAGLARPSSLQHPPRSSDELPQVHFYNLLAQQRWLEALDVALSQYRPGLEEVLEGAARELLRRGTPHLLLDKLRGQFSPQALRYQLVAAMELGREGEYLSWVEQALQTGEHPGLRAVCRSTLAAGSACRSHHGSPARNSPA